MWQLLPNGRLQGDFQLISRLRLQLEFILIYQHGAPNVRSPADTNLEIFNEPQTFCMTLKTLSNGGGGCLR